MKRINLLIICILIGFSLHAQQNSAQVVTAELNLEECIEYALKNSETAQIARLDVKEAEAQVGQTRADGLPQINASAAFMDNIMIPKSFLPAQLVDPNAEPGTFIPVTFQPRFFGQAGLNMRQLIFDGSFFVALQASRGYKDFAVKNMKVTESQIAADVSKAYYAVLINRERTGLLDQNISRLEKLLNDTEEMYKNGFVEKLDADRIRVNLNIVRAEKQRLASVSVITENVLKYQIGMRPADKLTLKDDLKTVDLEAGMPSEEPAFSFEKRPEYNLLKTKANLDELQIRNLKAGYLPKLFFSLSYGGNSGTNNFGDLVNFGDFWFANSNYTLSLEVPVFDGFRKKYMIEKGKIGRDKTLMQTKQLERTIEMQVSQAVLTLKSNLDLLAARKENVELAAEVFRLTNIKYKEGVGSNLELVEAENAQKQAETDYYSALYDVLIARVDLLTARGELIAK